MPTPASRRERAGGGALGSGPRRQPAAGERLPGRCWPLSVPSHPPCYSPFAAPARPAPPLLSAPRSLSRCLAASAHLSRPPTGPSDPGAWVVLGDGPRCLRSGERVSLRFPAGLAPWDREFGKIPSLLPRSGTLHLLPLGWRSPGLSWNSSPRQHARPQNVTYFSKPLTFTGKPDPKFR